MLKKLRNSLLICLTLMMVVGCVDQNGSQNDEETLTLAPTSVAVCEILDKLDVSKEQVVAIPSSDSYTVPKRYQGKEELGTAMSPDVEKLSTIQPDLILSPNSLEGDLSEKYEKIGISSTFLNLKSIGGMFKSIEELGKLLNKEKKAEKLVKEFTDYMVAFREKHQNMTSPRVLILMGLPGGSYVVATESSYVGDLVRLAGM